MYVFCRPGEGFLTVSKKVLVWLMRMKGIQEVLVRLVTTVMRDQKQELEWILSRERSFGLKWGGCKHLCY